MSPDVVRHPDAAAFLERAAPWLAEREAENNLVLGIADRLARGEHDWEPPFYLATVEREGRVVGCAWRTPPHKVGLTRMPVAAVPALAADVAGLYDAVPGVMGEDAIAGAFARRWAELRGVDVRAGMRMRIHQLERVEPPTRRPPGAMRVARPADHELLTSWWEAFSREADVQVSRDAERAVLQKIEAGVLWVWEDGEVVSMAGAGSRTPNGVRIGPVYTPPEGRRRGYATALVADLSARQLAEGRSCCFLYTDLANPTSNAIYGRVGYRPVCDVRDFHFGA